ncbi:MAG: PAS domain S-box protein [Defluviitaleaceae bacterium]|nr:PAS domain S-box protein [Defluviitaleaceae bacterium]
MTETKRNAVENNIELCTGCNRCVRECPMETANVTYQDEAGNIKVKIDQDKCISCGWCVSACKHEARYYQDDTERFFDDLAGGAQISIITAPSIRTNISDHKKLFTYFKQIGVKNIYDVSLGADICVWAYIRHLERNGFDPIITQPCPVIVSYCEKYRHDLLKRLAPVQSPMACASIYMKKYMGITDKIAAFSPCIAKMNEFEGTRLAQYNITFAKLMEYLSKKGVTLPETETGFDHAESGLGSLFPLPGGLKENIEYYTGKKLHIVKGEGFNVYEKLDTYAETPERALPVLFDVLNCMEGCNVGPACMHESNVFEIEMTMNEARKKAGGERSKGDNLAAYEAFDRKLDLDHFMREYVPVEIPLKNITDEDIETAFRELEKNDDEKRNVDCGACGSKTCLHMARKIAHKVNIPMNCIVKTMDNAKSEHEENMAAQNQIAAMEKMHEADELMRTMLNASPFGANFWTRNMELIDINEATLTMFKLTDKRDYIENFQSFSPTYQPDGRLSIEAAAESLEYAFQHGWGRFEWMHQTKDGEELPCEITTVRMDYKGDYIVAVYLRNLKEQKHMIQEIESAQFTTKAMFESNPHVNVLFNDKFKLIDCNPAGITFLGFENKEEMLENFVGIMVKSIPSHQPDGRESIPLAHRLMTAAKEGYARFETEMTIKGAKKFLNVEFKRIPYEQSFAIVGYIFDMTEIRNREDELIRARAQNELQLAKLNLVMKASKIGLWDMEIVKGDSISGASALMYSDEFRQMLGFTELAEFPNLLSSWIERLHPDDLEKSTEAFKRHLADVTGKTPFDVEYRMLKKDGEYSYFHATGETIRDENGDAVRVAGALIDITESKKLLLDLETERSLLQTMFDSVPDMIYCKDMDLNYTRCNKSLLNYFNISKDDLIGKDDEKGLGISETLADDFRAMDKAVIHDNRIYTYEEYFPSTDGAMRLFETNKVPLMLNGEMTGIMGIARDITERKAMEEAAQSANKAKTAFLSTMSHEIRTPMNAILGITDIMLHKGALESSIREGLEKIYTSGDMLLGIINDILDLSKIEAGKLELLDSKYEMASLISDTAQLNMMRIGSKPIEFDLRADENLPVFLSGDELRVKQILNNILSNAFKYTSEGTVTMTVASRPSEGDEDKITLIVSIKDTGQGMNDEQVGKLFDEYARFNHEANRSTEGTGLGMSITRNLIRMMNGEITIESELGKGSVFTIYLPQGRINSDVLGREMVENLQKFKTNSRSQLKRVQIKREPMPYGSVLIVDDVETNIFVAKGLLAPYELRIDSTDSGFGAIEKIKNGSEYSVIFMDHMMPKMDGVETTKRLREMGYKNPIVALTANAVAGQAEIFLGNGFNDYISKPIDIRQLNSVLNKLIRDKQPPEILAKAKAAESIRLPIAASAADNLRFAEIFVRDAKKSAAVLDAFLQKGSERDESDMRMFIIHTHGIKSALANIGRLDLSAAALKLEQLGRDNSVDSIIAETPPFLEALKSYIMELSPEIGGAEPADEDKGFLSQNLGAIKTACEVFDDAAVEELLAGLKSKTWTKKTAEFIDKISEDFLHSDFDGITDAIDGFGEA